LGSALLLESLAELLELLLELVGSESGSAGGASEGNGCSSSAAFRDEEEAGGGASGASLDEEGRLGSPGNGNCSAVEGCFVSGGGVQGLSEEDLTEGGQGGLVGF
jgi:hypothetical protein